MATRRVPSPALAPRVRPCAAAAAAGWAPRRRLPGSCRPRSGTRHRLKPCSGLVLAPQVRRSLHKGPEAIAACQHKLQRLALRSQQLGATVGMLRSQAASVSATLASFAEMEAEAGAGAAMLSVLSRSESVMECRAAPEPAAVAGKSASFGTRAVAYRIFS